MCIDSSKLHVCRVPNICYGYVSKIGTERTDHATVTNVQYNTDKFMYISRKLFKVFPKPMAFTN
jgi:hypothetical protein